MSARRRALRPGQLRRYRLVGATRSRGYPSTRPGRQYRQLRGEPQHQFHERLLREIDVAVHHVADDIADQVASKGDRKSTRLNSSHQIISYAVFCLKKKT